MILEQKASTDYSSATMTITKWKERQHLDLATQATSPLNITHVLVYWESCLQGSVNPAAEQASANSDILVRTAITGNRTRSAEALLVWHLSWLLTLPI